MRLANLNLLIPHGSATFVPKQLSMTSARRADG
jgi:hypothetical protein